MLIRSLLLVVALQVMGPAAWANEDLSSKQQAAVKTIVREYFRQHPEVIVEALQEMQARGRTAENRPSRETLAALHDELLNDKSAPIGGNPDGNITIIEFLDYRCGYCKKMFPGLMATLKSDGNIKYMLREFPILGPASLFASKAALAVWQTEPGRYMDFHTALMKNTGNLTNSKVIRLAQNIGLNTNKLRVSMDSPAIEAVINRNYEIAKVLNISGTPVFIIGGKLVPGAVGVDALKRLVAEARNTRS
jgi:protein-disulfide isomerase